MHLPAEIYATVLAMMPIPCVDLLVVDPDNRVLLVERRNVPARGAWWFPGGRVHRDELRATAARRKLAEECGLVPTSARELGTFDILLPEAHAISTVFELRVETTEVRLDAQSSRFAWRSRAAWLATALHPFVASVLQL